MPLPLRYAARIDLLRWRNVGAPGGELVDGRVPDLPTCRCHV